MKEVSAFLKENGKGFLATVEEGKPRVRPFQYMLEEQGRFYFCTSNAKDVYQQLKAQPFVEFSSMSPAFAWVRLRGEIHFSQDATIKTKIIEANPLVKSLYKTPDNPVFEIFYVEHGQAILADFSGKPQREFEF